MLRQGLRTQAGVGAGAGRLLSCVIVHPSRLLPLASIGGSDETKNAFTVPLGVAAMNLSTETMMHSTTC